MTAHAVCGHCAITLVPMATLLLKKDRKISVVELPLGATEDRLVGTLNLEHALKTGEKRFEPGILAQAHRSILYVDEVNLLDDHLVDSAAGFGGYGYEHRGARGCLVRSSGSFYVGWHNESEEGELRPQLLDRFGLCVNIEGIRDAQARVEIMERRLKFDKEPARFSDEWSAESAKISERIQIAQTLCANVETEKSILEQIASACLKLGVDGHRADIAILKTSRALAAYEGQCKVESEHVAVAAELALPHRVRRTLSTVLQLRLLPRSDELCPQSGDSTASAGNAREEKSVLSFVQPLTSRISLLSLNRR